MIGALRPERAAYAAVSVATTVAGAMGQHRAHALAKVAMVPALQGSVIRRWGDLCGKSRTGLIGATTAALVGDVLLVSPAEGESDETARRRLRRGAAAFGVQQLGYLGMLRYLGARPRWRTAVPVAVLLAGLAALDTAKESRPDPVVTAYGVLLGAMSAHAMEASDPRIRLGGTAFLASDATILVREQLLRDRPQAQLAAGAFVMTTYALAQRWLIDGFVEGLAE
jgi:uncharacterized membrane protein YhhN